MRFDNPHYYEILEVAESATQQEISVSFRRLAKEYHPDRIPSYLSRLKQEAQEKVKLINEAYQILSDPEKRRQYDAYLKELEKETEERGKYQTNDYWETRSTEEEEEEEEPDVEQEPEKVIITCPSCEQKLKVPEGLALQVTCPSCSEVFDYPFTDKKDFITLQISKNKAITFSEVYVEYDGEKLFYKDIVSISYDSERTSIILIDQSYSFSIKTDSDMILVTFSSGLFLAGNKEKTELFGKLIFLSKSLIEPIIVKKFYRVISEIESSVSIAGITLSKTGFWKERWFRDPEFLAWNQYDGSDIQEGYIILYKNVIGKGQREFTRVPMSKDNAVILPELMALCANELRKHSRRSARICPSCGKETEGEGKLCQHCQDKTKKESHSRTERSWDDQWRHQNQEPPASGMSGKSKQGGPSTSSDTPRAGIWLRVFAYIIDFSILTCGMEALLWYVYIVIYPSLLVFLGYLLIFPLYFIYFMYLQSHGRQTIGERFIGIKVFTLPEAPLTKKRALLRYLCF